MRRVVPWGGLIVLGLIASALPALHPTNRTMALAILACIYALVTYGLAFLFGTGGLLSIAHGGLWGVGAYAAAILAMKHGWGFGQSVLAAIVVTALAATFVALLSLRVKGHYFTIITFAVAEGIRALINVWTSFTNGTEGIVVSKVAVLGGWRIGGVDDWYYLVLGTLVLVMAVYRMLVISPFGRRLAATRDNVDLASSVGIGVRGLRVIAFAFSGMLAGIGGAYWAFQQSYVQGDQFGATASITFLLVMLLGGAKYLYGPVIGAIIVVFLPPTFNLSPLLGQAALGVVFIIVILVAPGGIASIGDRLAHWRKRRRTTPGFDVQTAEPALAADLNATNGALR